MTIIEQAMQSGSPVGESLSKRAEQDLVQYCDKAFNIARQGRLQFEKQWYLNLSFYFGRQYAQWVTSALDASGLSTEASFSRLYEPAVPPWRVRLICNKTRPVIRGELAKITKEKPRGFIIPASTDDDDLAGARAGEAIHEYLWCELNMNRVVRRAVFWELLCGSSFIKDWYEPETVDSSGVKGSIKSEPVSPFHFFVPDLQEEELESQPYVIHAMAKDPDWAFRNFGIRVQADSQSGSGILEQKFLSALGINTGSNDKRYVSVKELWLKPNARFKDGAWILWAGSSIINIKEGWPYSHKEYPFAKLDHISTGRFYGESTIVDIIPLQKQINRIKSQLLEASNRTAKPQLMAIRGSVEPNKITSEPGLMIFVKPGYTMPTPVPLQNIPSYVIEQLNMLYGDVDDVASQHEISKGSVPSQVSAATAISFLSEQDDSKLHTTIASLEEGVEKVGRHLLSHAHQFWTAQRKIRIIGKNGQFESYEFSQSDIRGNIDFKIESGSATPTSRAAKQAFITELGKMGWISPDRALRYLDMAETGRLYEEMQLDARQAQRENLRLLQGEHFACNTYDVHPIHIMEHDNSRKTESFENSEDNVKVAYEEHVTSHQQRMAQTQGVNLAPGDPKLGSIPVGVPQDGQNGQQSPQPPGSAQGGVNAL